MSINTEVPHNLRNPSIIILTEPRLVMPYVDAVCAAGDGNSDALGWFANSVYEELARKGALYVATIQSESDSLYAGHLLLDLRFPRAKVLQMNCANQYRRRGVASALLGEAIAKLTSQGYLTLQARVADDLEVANKFWDSQGLYVQRTERGGGKRERQIIVRVRELDSPQLFERSSLALDEGNPLGLRAASAAELPLYLLDLNVLFDLGQHRIRHEEAKELFRSSNDGHCRLAVSDEITEELKRTQRVGATDPMFEFVDTLPQFACPKGEELKSFTDALAQIVFPNQLRDQTLSRNDKSDLAHVATALLHGLSGFITSDDALLRAAPVIQMKYGLRVMSPAVFQGVKETAPSHRAVMISSDRQLTLNVPNKADETAIRKFLLAQNITPVGIASHWWPPSLSASVYRLAAWIESDAVGFITWSRSSAQSQHVSIFAAVDERNDEAPNTARFLLRALLESIDKGEPFEMHLHLPEHQSELKERASSYGFHRMADSKSLVKIAVGRVVTASNWSASREAIVNLSGLKIPKSAPIYQRDNQLLEIYSPNGDRRYIALDTLETTLSPVLFALPGRSAVMSPIEERFAKPLLGSGIQRSLLPAGTADLHTERHYISGPNTRKHLARGTLMLFYESGAGGGAKEVVAVARVTESFLKRRDSLDVSQLERSVLTPNALADLGASAITTVTAIDNIFCFTKPVPLVRLRSLGCGDPNQLITTRPLTDSQVQAILSEGFENE